MGSDQYLREFDAIDETCSSLFSIVEEYSENVELVNNAVMGLALSEWIDTDVKEMFIENANTYIEMFRLLSQELDKLVKYLESNNSSARALEQAYSKR